LNPIHQTDFFFVGPAIAMSTALMTSAVIPWGDTAFIWKDILLQATDLNIGYYTFELFQWVFTEL
jgi:NADH-quinone oxidoreductase subunit H